MRLTGQPGNFGPYPDWEAGKALLRRAAELGVQLIDTARAYGPGWNEELVAEALHPYPAGLVVATKGGIEKTGPNPSDIRPDGRPEALERHLEESLRRLKVERIDLYYLHRPDPAVPFEAQAEALARARAAGKIRFVGLSNVSVDQLEAARAVVPVAAVQNRYNVQEDGDAAMVDLTARLGIAYVPWGPLGAAPMRQGAPLAGTLGTAAALRALLDRSPNIVPIPGTTSLAHLEENLAALAGGGLEPGRVGR
jgi:aryl-alcohol dehydrogenase-like predicted oxidoreductase